MMVVGCTRFRLIRLALNLTILQVAMEIKVVCFVEWLIQDIIKDFMRMRDGGIMVLIYMRRVVLTYMLQEEGKFIIMPIILKAEGYM